MLRVRHEPRELAMAQELPRTDELSAACANRSACSTSWSRPRATCTTADSGRTAVGSLRSLGICSPVPTNTATYWSRVRQPIDWTPAAELLCAVLPPLTTGVKGFSLAAQIEPSLAVGGDALDYAQSATNDSLAFFEAVGYALGASLIAGCAIARVPFGVEHSDVVVGEEPLQPGDWLVLHTDGITEARDHDGAFSAKSGCATSSLGKRRRGSTAGDSPPADSGRTPVPTRRASGRCHGRVDDLGKRRNLGQALRGTAGASR